MASTNVHIRICIKKTTSGKAALASKIQNRADLPESRQCASEEKPFAIVHPYISRQRPLGLLTLFDPCNDNFRPNVEYMTLSVSSLILVLEF